MSNRGGTFGAMRKLLLVAAATLVVSAAWAQVKPDQGGAKKFANCAATGSSAQVLPNGKWYMTVFDSRTTVCFGSICDGGVGVDFPADTAHHLKLQATDGGTPVACLSFDGGGDVHFLRDALQ